MTKVAIVTPYHKEDTALLLQCHRSVVEQTYPCTHIMVADGYPNPAVSSFEQTLHVTLPTSHGDFGNTPRFFGAALAESDGFDAIAFLDADNWYEPDHVQSLLTAHQSSGYPLIGCKRNFYSDAGERLEITDPLEEMRGHIDTSCWLIFREAFDLLRYWRMPREFCWAGDRLFLRKAAHDRYSIAFTNFRTVNYRTRHADHFRLAGKPAPENAIGIEPLLKARERAMTVEGVQALVKFFGFYPEI